MARLDYFKALEKDANLQKQNKVSTFLNDNYDEMLDNKYLESERDISCDLIKTNSKNTFSVVENEEFFTLKKSIETYGLTNPIVVKVTDDNKFEIMAGHRRFKACNELGYTKIRAKIYKFEDNLSEFMFLGLDNFSSRKIGPIEMAIYINSINETLLKDNYYENKEGRSREIFINFLSDHGIKMSSKKAEYLLEIAQLPKDFLAIEKDNCFFTQNELIKISKVYKKTSNKSVVETMLLEGLDKLKNATEEEKAAIVKTLIVDISSLDKKPEKKAGRPKSCKTIITSLSKTIKSIDNVNFTKKDVELLEEIDTLIDELNNYKNKINNL